MKRNLLLTTALASALLLGACTKPAPRADATSTAAPKPAASATTPKPVNADAAENPQLLQEAVTALNETQNALAAIDRGDGKAASTALENATGKLEIVLAKNPSLALAPVDIGVTTHDLIATLGDVEAARKLAKDALNDGRLQDARGIMQGLASETDVTVSNLPLATYPSAIKSAAALLAQNKLPEAKEVLQSALSTVVIHEIVFPLPLERAQAAIAQAKVLATNAHRSSADDAKLQALLNQARSQLKLGQALGYATPGDMKDLVAAVDDLERSTANKASGGSFFDRMTQLLAKAHTASQPRSK